MEVLNSENRMSPGSEHILKVLRNLKKQRLNAQALDRVTSQRKQSVNKWYDNQ